MCPGMHRPRAQEKAVVLGVSQDSCQCLQPTRGNPEFGGWWGSVCQAQSFEWNQRREEPGPLALAPQKHTRVPAATATDELGRGGSRLTLSG